MDANGVVAAFRRRSRAEAERLVLEFERSGLRRKEFCAAHGLSVNTLDAWRKRVADFSSTGSVSTDSVSTDSVSGKKLVPVEIVDHRPSMVSEHAGGEARNGQFRIVLARGLRIEVEPGFDGAELRRLIAALDGGDERGCLSRPV